MVKVGLGLGVLDSTDQSIPYTYRTQATDVYAYGITLFELFVVPYDIPYSQWEADEVQYTGRIED